MEEYIGIIKLFAGIFAPQGWMFCQGQLLPIAQYTALFSVLGTTYGGDGIQTFALPDLRGRVPLGYGQGLGLSSYTQGEKGGTETQTLSPSNLPPHTHSAHLSVSSKNATQSAATQNAAIATPGIENGRTFTATSGFNTEAPDTALNQASIQIGGGGNNVPFDVRQPYIAMNYIICIYGVYPPRS